MSWAILISMFFIGILWSVPLYAVLGRAVGEPIFVLVSIACSLYVGFVSGYFFSSVIGVFFGCTFCVLSVHRAMKKMGPVDRNRLQRPIWK
ncbi:TPA: hypothetical protein DF272_06590 [Candidatus Falkowbacteria bacterium]|nr:hypothetical protein [Candidatus Falkowbacteria bacterium]